MKLKKGIFSINLNQFEGMEARVPEDNVRTRLAPSPTGYVHVGNLHTALCAWLIAHHSGGKFIFCTEDTDQGRLVEGATEVTYVTLRKCGLTWGEGSGIDGPVGPYIQIKRRALYGKYAKLLVEKDHAHYCLCEKTGSEEDSGNFDRVADPYRDMSLEEARVKVAVGASYVIRQKAPAGGSTIFSDTVFGNTTVENSTLDDQVLIKWDGLLIYNFANVIDGRLMGTTHVVRGSEYLSSAPRYSLLCQGLGWDVSTYIHCFPVMRDAHNKMSKCKGGPSYENLTAMGYLSEAVTNYATLLGWFPRSGYAERESFTLTELVEIFDTGGTSKSSAISDVEELTYLSAHYLQEMSPEAFHAVALPYIRQAVRNPALSTEEITGLLQTQCERLIDIPEKLGFFDTLPGYDVELFTNKRFKINPGMPRRMLKAVFPALDGLVDWTVDGIHDALIGLAESLEIKNAALMWPVRITATGRTATPDGAVEICHVLGRDKCLRRLCLGPDKLGG